MHFPVSLLNKVKVFSGYEYLRCTRAPHIHDAVDTINMYFIVDSGEVFRLLDLLTVIVANDPTKLCKWECEDLVRVLSWSMQTLPCERSPSYECMPIFYGGALCITGSSTKVSQESSWNIPVPYNFTMPRKPTHPGHIDSTSLPCNTPIYSSKAAESSKSFSKRLMSKA